MSGTLTSDQSKWLAALVKPSGGGKGDLAGKSDTAKVRMATRREVLDGVLRNVGRIHTRLADAMKGYELITSGGKTMKLLTGDLNPDDEIDTRHDIRGDTAIKDPGALKEIRETYQVLLDQSAILRNARAKPDGTLSDDNSGDALFTEADIANEIWTPLVRAGVLPENMVDKRYSEVAKLFAGAQAEYGKRLAAYSEQAEEKNALADNLGLASEAVTSIGKIADGLADGIMEQQGVAKELKKSVKDGIALIAAIGSGGLATAQALANGLDGPTVVKAAIAGVKQAIGAAELADATKKILIKAVEIAVQGGTFVPLLLKGEVAAASGSVADAIAGGLEAVGAYYDDPSYAQLGGRLKGSIKSLAAAKKMRSLYSAGGPELTDAISDFVKEAGDLAVHEIKSSVENTKRLELERKQKGITEELEARLKEAQRSIEALTGECFTVSKVQEDIESIVQSGQMQAALEAHAALTAKWKELLCAAAKGRDPTPIGQEIVILALAAKSTVEALEVLRQQVAASVEKAKQEREKLAPPSEEGDGDDEEEGGDDPEEEDPSDKVKEIMAQLAAAQDALEPADALVANVEAKARLEKIQADAEAFGQALRNDFTAAMNETDDGVQQARLAVSKLAPLLETLKRNSAYLKLADTLVTVGVTVGKTMFEELGPLGSFKECATSIYTAIGHMRELARWEESMADSRNAGASALVAAEFNRVGLEKRFRTADWTNAAIKAVETIGGALKVAVVAVPLGVAMEGAAKVGSEGAKLVTKFYAAGELKAAWADYQAAMQDPEDRKAVRRALRSNATLAKYALAWAAVTQRDPLARDAMRKTGLTDAVLADKETNAQDVVEYLEAVYNNDPIILQATPTREDWWPGTPALSSRNWIKFLKAAEQSDSGLQGESAILVTQLLVRMEKRVPEDFPQPIDDDDVADARAALDEVIDALADYAPLTEDDEPSEGMKKYADALRAQAELRRRRLPASLVVGS